MQVIQQYKLRINDVRFNGTKPGPDYLITLPADNFLLDAVIQSIPTGHKQFPPDKISGPLFQFSSTI